MKKYFLISISVMLCFLLSGCGKSGESDVVKQLTQKIEKTKSYHVTGQLEIMSNEDNYQYDVEVSYEKENQFRVSLKNKTNNHEQIILKNTDGVYVLTPSLNKSFKFQSEWPYNNSQSYLLQNIVEDIKNDSNRTFQEENGNYIFTTKVNYSNNKELTKQKVYIDKDLNVNKVEVMDNNDQVQMKMQFTEIDLKASYDENYFTLKDNMKTSEQNDTSSTVGKIDSIVYPMYIPNNTKLADQEKLSTDNGERVILTFSGENPFMFVQETTKPSKDMVTIPMYGEPELITGTVAAVSDSSVTWVSNGMEYYVVSDVLSNEQLLEIAKSVSTMPVSK